MSKGISIGTIFHADLEKSKELINSWDLIKNLTKIVFISRLIKPLTSSLENIISVIKIYSQGIKLKIILEGVQGLNK